MDFILILFCFFLLFLLLFYITCGLAYNQLRFILNMIDAGGLTVRICIHEGFNLAHDNIAGIPPFQRYKVLYGGEGHM